jgi:hypothetical protein
MPAEAQLHEIIHKTRLWKPDVVFPEKSGDSPVFAPQAFSHLQVKQSKYMLTV